MPIDDKKLLEKCKTIWSKINDLKNIELDAFPVFDDRYIKNKIRTYDGEFILIFMVYMCQMMV